MAVDESRLRALAESLGYAPGQLGRLREALTHKSFANEVSDGTAFNERLEFLGDAVLGLVVADALMAAHPTASEGTLSRLRAGLVNGRSLAEAARHVGIDAALRLGKGEERSGGRKKTSLLGDAFEAMLGAVYLDHGFEAARAQVLAHFGGAVAHDETRAADRDYKTRLQELVQVRFQCAPVYTVLDSRGPDHQKVFEVAVSVGGQLLGQGHGPSKKRAEREAARVACERVVEGGLFELPVPPTAASNLPTSPEASPEASPMAGPETSPATRPVSGPAASPEPSPAASPEPSPAARPADLSAQEFEDAEA